MPGYECFRDSNGERDKKKEPSRASRKARFFPFMNPKVGERPVHCSPTIFRIANVLLRSASSLNILHGLFCASIWRRRKKRRRRRLDGSYFVCSIGLFSRFCTYSLSPFVFILSAFFFFLFLMTIS